MKCAIFLLALCAFHAVFANPQFMQQLDKLRANCMYELNSVVDKFRTEIEVSIKYLKSKGISDRIYECMIYYDILVLFHESHRRNYEDCYKKGIQGVDIEIARKCYSFNYAALKKQDELYRVDSKICLARKIFPGWS